MKAFADYNPFSVLIYFLAAAGIPMFCMNPVILALSLLGSLLLFFIRSRRTGIASHLFFLAMFAVIALINPLFYHNGVTVLFVMNDNPVTLEALLYGITAAVMIISVIYWFRSFSQIMTSDRMLYLFGKASPKLALILSMTLRYIPLFCNQTKKVADTQRALGLYKEDNALDSLRGGSRVFSVMVTWALENGIITADSMTARGYGSGRRSFFSIYRFSGRDALLLAATLVLLLVTIAGAGASALDFIFYPAIGELNTSHIALASYASYGLLAFMPSFIEISEGIRWKYLQSKI